MEDTYTYDRIIKNVRVVRPRRIGAELVDLAVRDGRFAAVAPELPAGDAREIFDARGLLGFPGAVDAHMHIGIYRELSRDARSESRAAASGGVTSALTYTRTGRYYLERGGSYRDFFQEVLRRSAGNYYVDYGYHIAPMSRDHIDEMPMLLEEFGVCTFKIFMFYGSYGLHGRSDQQNKFLMIGADEKYDLAHFEFIMRAVVRLAAAHPEIAEFISLSLHCENPEIMDAYTRMAERAGKLRGLQAYSDARPPHSEGLAVTIASYLAHETGCRNINLLHLSSRKAVEAALAVRDAFPEVNFRREATIGHLLLDVDAPTGILAKVNPPVRPRADREFLWQAVLDGKIDHVITDHACCPRELKIDASKPEAIFAAKSGFGGTEYLLPGLFSEGKKRGLSYNRIAELTSYNAARRFGLPGKGDIAPGYDADLALLDPDETWVVRAAESESEQGYTPMEGMELTGRVKSTFLRGELVYDQGRIVGEPRGRYLKRPYGLAA